MRTGDHCRFTAMNVQRFYREGEPFENTIYEKSSEGTSAPFFVYRPPALWMPASVRLGLSFPASRTRRMDFSAGREQGRAA